MPLLILIGLFVPRIAIALLYFLTSWFSGVFHTWYWPLLGFLIMPYTLLWYSVVMNWFNGVWGTPQIVVLVIAVVVDIGSGERTLRW